MIPLVSLAPFLVASALVILVPGPATLLVLAQAARGPGPALRSLAGIVLGDVVLIALAAAGVAGLVSAFPAVAWMLRVGGGLYVAALGVGLITAAVRGGDVADTAEATEAGFRRGLALTLTNPKPILFFSAFFPLFIPAGVAPFAGFAVLGALFEALNLAWFAGLIALMGGVGGLGLLRRMPRRSFTLLSGAGLLACSALILVTHRP